MPDSSTSQSPSAAENIAANWDQPLGSPSNSAAANVVLTRRIWWRQLTLRTSRRGLRGNSRRRDQALLNPLAYEQLDKRQLLASGSDTSGDPPNLLLDLPPVASSTLQQLLSSSGGFSSGLWQQSPDQLNYNAGNWAVQLAPQQFDPRDWSGYTINTSVPSGFSVSNLKSIVPLEENNGYLVLVRQRTTGRTLSGGGPAGGGLEGGGGGMGRGSEQVDSLVLSSIFHVRTQAEADAINPLTYNPADFPSRMVVTSNTQFNFRDTTVAGQLRSVAVALTYQVSLNFTWGGSWTSREGSTGDTSNERRVNYASSGTVWFSGGHTYVGIVNMTPSGELHEVGFAAGSGLSGVYLTSANVTTLSHSSGSLSADSSGFGTRSQGTLTADLLQTRNQLYGYIENSSRWLSSGRRQSSLARTDLLAYTLLSNPQAELSYTSRQDLAPADAGEVFGFEPPTNPPSGSATSTSFVARAGGALTSHSRLNAAGYRNISTSINTAYDGKRDISFASSGVDNTNTQGANESQNAEFELKLRSPQTEAVKKLSLNYSEESGDVTQVENNAWLSYTLYPNAPEDERNLQGFNDSRGKLLVSNLDWDSSYQFSNRAATIKATPGSDNSQLVLANGTSSFLNGFAPIGMGTNTPAPLNLQSAPLASGDKRTNYFWEASSGQISRNEQLAKPGRFRTRTDYRPTGQTELLAEIDIERRSQYESNTKGSTDLLTIVGRAPIISQSSSGEAPTFRLEASQQLGPGEFTHLQNRLSNHYVSHGTSHSKDYLTSKFTPWASGQTPPTQGDADLSMTIALGVDGWTANTREQSFATTEQVLSNDTDSGQTQSAAGFKQEGTADGDHKFLRWVNKLVFDENTQGSGQSSSNDGDSNKPGEAVAKTSGTGGMSADITGQGYFYSLYELDEQKTAGTGSGAGNPNGLLAGTQGMNYQLKYRVERKSPLSSIGSTSEGWDNDLNQSTLGVIDPNTGEESNQALPPPDPSKPTYSVGVGDKGEVRFQGTGDQTSSTDYRFVERAPWFDLDYDLRAWTETPGEDRPAELIRRNSVRTSENVQPTEYIIVDRTTTSIEPGLHGIKIIGNGPRTTTTKSSSGVYNPKELLNQQTFHLPGGGQRTESDRTPENQRREFLEQVTTHEEDLEDYGSILTFVGQIDTDNQLASVDQLLTPSEKKFGVLKEGVSSVGNSSQYSKLTRLVDLQLPESFTGSGRNGFEGGTTSHTRTETRTSEWNMLNNYRHVYDDAGALTTTFTPSGFQKNKDWVWTNGAHDLLFYSLDPQDSALVRTKQDGSYSSFALLEKDLIRSGSRITKLGLGGELISAAGEIVDRIDGQGHAYASDTSEVRKLKPGFASYRKLIRNSEDHYDADLTQTLRATSGTPEMAFLNHVNGSLTTTETKSVVTPTGTLPSTTVTLNGTYDDTENSAEGDRFIDGFSSGVNYRSLAYQGQPLDTNFNLTLPLSFLPSYSRDLGGSNDDGPGGDNGGGGVWKGPESDQILSISKLNPLKPEERERLDNRWNNFLHNFTRSLTGALDDVVDGTSAFTGGFSEVLTGGLSSRFNEWMYGDIHAQNQESWLWTGGQLTGLAASFILPGGSAQAACKASGLVRGFSAFNQSMMWAGAAESVANIASTGEVTFGDAIGLLGPLAHALGQRTGKMLSNGGCFVAGTPVWLSSLPRGWQPRASDPWSQPQWLEQLLGEESDFFGVAVGRPALAQAGVVLAPAVERVAIDEVPLGGRVPTRNPRRWEYDGSLPEPDEASWAKLSITVQRNDGGVVDAELLRPRAWIELHGIVAGQLLPLHLAELEVSGQALVTAIEACPPIADGEGSVVTARFVTREVHVVASVEVLGPDGSVETITGTTIHPVWSVDRQEWVPLAELKEGEQLLALPPSPPWGRGTEGEGAASAIVLSVTLSRVSQPVYNLEIHGEHVYQVGELGVLVHNAGINCEVLVRHSAGNRQVLLGNQRWHIPKGFQTSQLPFIDRLGDQIQDAALLAAQRWNRSFLSPNEIAAIRKAQAKGDHWQAVLLEKQARGRWVESAVRRNGFPELDWSRTGADAVDRATGIAYEILAGSKFNLDLHARRMSNLLFRMITF